MNTKTEAKHTPFHHHPADGGFREDCKRCRLDAASPELLEALQLDMAFHGRPFARDSIEEFRLLGYNGPAASGEMRAFLWEKKRAAISKAEKGAQ
jgi:hypothetical protein